MNSQTFQLQTKNGHLIIPPELQDYLTHCPDSTKISLIIEPQPLNSSELKPNQDDPDQGKEVKESFQQSLLAIRQKRAEGRPTISEAEVYQRYGISC